MDNFIRFFTDSKGCTWYICVDCGNKERKKYNFCPVCKNTERNPNKELQALIAFIATNGGI